MKINLQCQNKHKLLLYLAYISEFARGGVPIGTHSQVHTVNTQNPRNENKNSKFMES